ncbi:YidC/Oxa1 family membrane protein insertase [Jonquetella anthropi]|uniref:YidC/Oxa1 family membrane protein insertase n=1 Tax=Jonquetella TaxID=428711 RepID=UPI0001B91074|nr:membrane protein insertase, YidC/Oxa1 family [Jonquetella anthropi E3_33 E1]
MNAVWAAASKALYDFLSLIYSVVGSWGWAILILTLIIRAVLHPLNKKQMVSMQKMQKLQPRIKVLQEKYANDRETLGRETMALYRENKVNPASGCLPLLIQLPILILLFQVLRTSSFGGASFFGISLEGSVYTQLAQATGFAFNNPSELGFFALMSHVFKNPSGLSNVLIWLPNLALVILICYLTWLQQKMSSAGNQQMGAMLVFMPILMAFICLSLPGGVALYWAASSLLAAIQQIQVVRKVENEEKPVLLKDRPKKESD